MLADSGCTSGNLAGSTGAQRHLLGCANNICALACSGNTIVSAEAGKLGLIRLWDAPSGQCQALLHGKHMLLPSSIAHAFTAAPGFEIVRDAEAAFGSAHYLFMISMLD